MGAEPRLVRDAAERHGFALKDGCIDMRAATFEDAAAFLYELRDSGRFVFHGTNASERYPVLEARQANDASKESGNKKAVYATVDPWSALSHAILDKRYLQSRFKHFVTGEGGGTDRPQYHFSPNVFALFLERDPRLFSDGYVYLLDRERFVSAPDAGEIEWHAESDQEPLVACRVSASLGTRVFSLDEGTRTVFAYPPEKMREIEEFVERRGL